MSTYHTKINTQKEARQDKGRFSNEKSVCHILNG